MVLLSSWVRLRLMAHITSHAASWLLSVSMLPAQPKLWPNAKRLFTVAWLTGWDNISHWCSSLHYSHAKPERTSQWMYYGINTEALGLSS